MNRVKTYLLPALFILFFLLAPELQSQCAMCKQAAASSMKNDPNSMARSLNTGILYLMAVPYLAICFIFRKQIASLLRKVRGKFMRTRPADQLP